MKPNETTGPKARARCARILPLLPLLLGGPAPGLQVDRFTSEAVQEAVHAATAGDTLLLPAGEYAFTGTVVIDRSLTLLGAADLVDVGVVEPGEPNEPPYWSGAPSVCFTEDPDLVLFRVESDAVTFERLKLVGAITHETGSGDGITVLGHDRLVVRNCEITRLRQGVAFRNSRRSVVTGSYLHENYRNGFGYGVAISGPVMATGGSEVSIYRNEFTFNRHSIASNSPETRFAVEENYFHDNDLVEWQACVDTHAQGGYAIRAVVRDNIFERTRPMGFKSGSLEITGNYFDPGCGDYSVGGYSTMLDFSIPTHNGEFVPQAILHDIYIADNVNDTDPWRRLLWVDDWDYEGETRFVAYNVFVDGRLFRHNSALSSAPWHPFPDSSASPFVGHVYVTLPDSDERVRRIEAGPWYDLHAFAVDPQGYEDIAEIGVQIASVRSLPPDPEDRLQQQEFSLAESYFIRGTGTSLHSRETEGSSDWSDVTGVGGSCVDGAASKWSGRGRHRVRLRARFRLSDQAVGGSWRIFGYARDQDGNLPVRPWHEQLEGWPIEVEGVEEGPATAVADAGTADEAVAPKGQARGDLPQPLQPVGHHPFHPLRAAAGHPVDPRPQRPARRDPVQRAQGRRQPLRQVGRFRAGFGGIPLPAGGGGRGLPGEEDGPGQVSPDQGPTRSTRAGGLQRGERVMAPNQRIESKAGAMRALPLLLLLAGPAPGRQVDGFTSEAVQEAVYAASAGDTLFFPPGEYAFTATVVIDRSLTLLGAAELLDVGVVEPGEPNDPPYWSGPPSVCLTEDPDLRLFRVESDDVTFERLKLAGVVTHETGTCEGISVYGHDRLVVRNCEITRFLRGVDLRNSLRSVVTGSYLHENYRNGYGYGVAISGPTMEAGGSEVSIYRNEFTLNRHGIASNSPQTRFAVEENYFHDNDLVQGQACVDIHPQGGYTIRAVVRDNIFERTTPMGFKSGSIEITGNYIDPGCGDYEVGGYSRMLDFGPPTHNGNFIPQAILHDIYIADNVNDTDPWRRLLWVYDWEYEGETRFVAYNVFVDGRLFKHNSAMNNAPWHPYPGESPRPFVGQIYVTLADSDERVRRIEAGHWYDLHALAVDPQGWRDIAEIGVQIAHTRSLPPNREDRLRQLDFSAAESYFIRGTRDSLHSRETEGSPAWSDVTGVEGSYVDGAASKFAGRGLHRTRLRVRFRLSEQAVGGSWRIFGHARDQDGHLPIPAWHEQLEGWPIEVEGLEEGPATSVAGPAAGQGAAPVRASLDGIYPNPFNPAATIRFTLAEPRHVTLTIHALNGQVAETLLSAPRGAGSHSITWDASGRASGVYLCRLEAEGQASQVRKMVLVR